MIVLVTFPFSNQQGSTTRPAIIVQADYNNSRLDDVVVAMITTNTSRAKREKTQLLIEAISDAGRETGLISDSAIKCEHLVTLHKSLVRRRIGHLPEELRDQLDECLKAALDLK
jgi:mRNA interferase MazF